jgi:hypothetical protein
MGINNAYEGRWRYWYVAIIDWMLSHPGRPLKECAADLGRAENTIYMITETDLFKTHYHQRRNAFTQAHDAMLREKMTALASKSLDILTEVVDKKRDAIPVAHLTTIATSALDRLGYSPNKPQAPAGVTVNMPGSNPTLVTSISREELEEARTAMRLAQQNRAQIPLVSQFLPEGPRNRASEAHELEAASADQTGFAGLDSVLEAEEDESGSFTISTE